MFGKREKVFVSYSSKNTRFVNEEILPQIKRAKRDHWFAPRAIGGGDDWRMKLLDGLETCDRLLVVVSREAQESQYVPLELASATRKLLAKKARLDAREVYRAILPVKIDVRGPHGEKPEDSARLGGGATDEAVNDDSVEVDPYLLHPYLTLVNFINLPYNEQLNAQLHPKTGKYLDDDRGLTREQKRSIREYAQERAEARKRIAKAIRDPERLRWGFKPLGRVFAMLTHASVQRVVIAFALFFALSGLLVGGPQIIKTIGWEPPLFAPRAPSISRISITTDPAGPGARPMGPNEGIPVSVDAGPIRLLVHVATDDGAELNSQVTLRPVPSVAGGEGAIPLEEPAIMVSHDAMQTWQDAENAQISLREEPSKLHIWSTANGRETILPLTLPGVPAQPVATPPAISLEALTPGGPVSPQTVDETFPDADVPAFTVAAPTILRIASVGGDGESTTRKVRLVPPDAEFEQPAIMLSSDAMRTWQDAGDARIRLRDESGELYIRAVANGQETTLPVTLPALPETPVAPPPEISLEAMTPTGRITPSSVDDRYPDTDVPSLTVYSPTILRIASVAGDGEATTRKVRLLPPPTAEPQSVEFEPPAITVSADSMQSWQDADSARIRLQDVPVPLNIRATANGLESVARVTLPALPQTSIASPPDIVLEAQTRTGRVTPRSVDDLNPDSEVPAFNVSEPTILRIVSASADGGETTRKIRLMPSAELVEQPIYEQPTIIVKSDFMEQWARPGEVRIRPERESVELQIRARANGREVTEQVVILPAEAPRERPEPGDDPEQDMRLVATGNGVLYRSDGERCDDMYLEFFEAGQVVYADVSGCGVAQRFDFVGTQGDVVIGSYADDDVVVTCTLQEAEDKQVGIACSAPGNPEGGTIVIVSTYDESSS